MVAVRFVLLSMEVAALVATSVHRRSDHADKRCARAPEGDHLLLQRARPAVISTVGVSTSTTTTTLTSYWNLCREDCFPPYTTKEWSRKCKWNKCTECPECINSEDTTTSEPTTTIASTTSTTTPASYSTAEPTTTTASTTTTTRFSGELTCGSWCETNSESWSYKCSWSGCSGCNACLGPSWPAPATEEFPDALSIAYADWQCKKICESRAELVHGTSTGCCLYTPEQECMFYPGDSVDWQVSVSGQIAWTCTPNHAGEGECTGWTSDKGCKGGPPEVALQFVPNQVSVNLPGSLEDFVLAWSDEFDNCTFGKPDTSIWSFETTQRTDRLQWYTENNAECVDGKLVITAKKETPMEVGFDTWATRGTGNNQVWAAHYQYTSSSLTSKGKKSFILGGRGKVELRAKVDTRSGSFPAWWTLGEPDDFQIPCAGGWPGCGEIDIMEYVGNTGWMKTNFCNPHGGDDACSWGTGCDCDWNTVVKAVNETWADSFHTWVMEWDESQDIIKVTLDGALFNSQTFSAADPENTGRPENAFRGKRQYMILNLAIGFVGGDPTPTSFPMKFEIDYVRVYEEATAGR